MNNTTPIPASVQSLMQSILDGYTSRSPSYRYFENKKTKEMFCWTTEPMNNGKFVCWNYKPVGVGSRTGNPKKWKAIKKVEFSRRKSAKARAYSRYLKSLEGNDDAS